MAKEKSLEKSRLFLKNVMRKMGLEPTRYCYHKILSLARLPIPTLPQTHRADIILALLPTDVNSIFRIFYKLYQKL